VRLVMAVDNNKRQLEVNRVNRRSETHNSLSWIVSLNAAFFCLVSSFSGLNVVLWKNIVPPVDLQHLVVKW